MQWIKSLRKTSLRSVWLRSIVFVALGVALIIIFDCLTLFQMLSPKTLAELDPEHMEGAYVEDDIYYFYTPYLEEEQYRNNVATGRITGRQYIIDFDETYYMGLFVHSRDLDEAETMMDACEAYMNGEISFDQVPVMRVRGTITAMDSQEEGFYLDAAGGDSQVESIMLPYYIDHNRIGGNTFILTGLIAAAAVVLIVLGIAAPVKALTGGYQKKLLAKLRDMGDPELMAEKLELFYESTEPVSGVRLSREFVFFQSGPHSILLRPHDLAWAYQSTTQHRTNGIKTGKTYAAILRTMDGAQYTLGMTEDKVQKLLEAIHNTLPGVVLGYSKEIEQAYRKNRELFARRWDEAAAAAAAPQPEPVQDSAPTEQ